MVNYVSCRTIEIGALQIFTDDDDSLRPIHLQAVACTANSEVPNHYHSSTVSHNIQPGNKVGLFYSSQAHMGKDTPDIAVLTPRDVVHYEMSRPSVRSFPRRLEWSHPCPLQ